MCGLAGLLRFSGTSSDDAALARKMADAILHRGPDAGEVWSDGRVSLAHRRLAIIDLSPAGAQPMASACGRYRLAFNGEIYNYRSLRQELERHPDFGARIGFWRSQSDTEVILAAVTLCGITETLPKLAGMFAIALWDREEKCLTLVRDRAGEKPLYFARTQGALLFGSELKALRAVPGFHPDLDRDALALFLRHNAVPAPYSIYRGVRKVLPGTAVTIDAAGQETTREYWSIKEVAKAANRQSISATDAIDGLDALLRHTISEQMVADVPLGAFLSGGIDSSTVVAVMQSLSPRAVKTFSIGFENDAYNEATHAKAVAAHLGTDHTELYVTAGQAMDVIPRLPQIYDEPFADSSQIPTFLVSHLARQHVTVALSGDGGDEVFAGYNRYTVTAALWRHLRRIPGPLRAAAAAALLAVPPRIWDKAGAMLPAGLRHPSLGDKLHKGASVLSSRDVGALYRGLTSHWRTPDTLLIQGREPMQGLPLHTPPLPGISDVEHMMVLDFLSYLSDDVLTKVDRAAMAVSLETRVPLLDHRVVEYAWTLPQDVKLRNGDGKWVLREVLARYVPRTLTDRPKMGFGVPLDQWLRGPLRSWAEDFLAPDRLKRDAIFHPQAISKIWAEHLSGRRNWSYHLWDVLMFQAWADANR